MNVGSKATRRIQRHRRIRTKLIGTGQRPRLVVYRSARHIYAQLVDDETGRTLASASTQRLKTKSNVKSANEVGAEIAQQAVKLGIKEAIFDRGGYKYHGQVKAVAEGARQNDLKL